MAGTGRSSLLVDRRDCYQTSDMLIGKPVLLEVQSLESDLPYLQRNHHQVLIPQRAFRGRRDHWLYHDLRDRKGAGCILAESVSPRSKPVSATQTTSPSP